MITFNQIGSDVVHPGTYVEIDDAQQTASAGKPYTMMVFGTGSASATQPIEIPVQVSSANDGAAKFGRDSVVAHMLECVFTTNPNARVYACSQDHAAAGVKRVVTVDYSTYTVAAATAGVEYLYVGDSRFATSVAVGDVAATVAANMAAELAADAALLFDVAVAGAVVTLTAKSNGAHLNGLEVVASFYDSDAMPPSGARPTITQTVAGAGAPDLSASIASVVSYDFTHLANPYTDDANHALLLAEAESRAGALPGATSTGNGQNDFVVFEAFRGSEAQITTHLGDRNSKQFTTMAVEQGVTVNGDYYPGVLSADFKVAAATAAMSVKLVSIVANKPHTGEVYTCVTGAHPVAQFGWHIRNRLLQIGASAYSYDQAGRMMLLAVKTNRTQTDTGIPYTADLNVETQFAVSYLRWSLNQLFATQYANKRLASDGATGLPDDVVTPKIIKGAIIGLAQNDWVPKGIAESVAQVKANLQVERSIANCDRVNYSLAADIVNNLSVIAGRLTAVTC